MLKVSRKADYALRAMIYLSRHSIFESQMISSISEGTGVSRDFMAKILKELSIHGLVRSQKGAHGGYRLSLDPSEICFLDILKAIEGPIELNDCIPNNNCCDWFSSCEMYSVWNEIYYSMIGILEKTKLSQFSSSKKDTSKMKAGNRENLNSPPALIQIDSIQKLIVKN